MTSAKEDLDRLFQEALELAERMLAEHGEFFPFASVTRTSGEIVSVGADAEEERPASAEMIEVLTRALSEMALRGEVRAVALCWDCLVAPPGEPEKRDAIACRLEHASGDVALIYMPYFLEPEFGLDAPFRVPAERTIFCGSV